MEKTSSDDSIISLHANPALAEIRFALTSIQSLRLVKLNLFDIWKCLSVQQTQSAQF